MNPETHGRLLLAESDARVRQALTRLLEGEGYAVEVADAPSAIPAAIESFRPDAVLVDMPLPAWGAAGAEAAFGVFEVIRKPLATDELLHAVARATRHESVARAAPVVREVVDAGIRDRIIGATPVMQDVFSSIARVAPLRTTVMITGETGTGKELVARAIHELSPRADKAFVPVHCAALPETLLESELFGHVRGSFTGAHATRAGLLEEANGGTLFLDEISTLSPAIQIKLLRVLQERTVVRIGSNKPIPLDIRLVAASNVDLAAEVSAGRFRADLYYRIHVFPIRVPALRERLADIPLLVDHFRDRFAEANEIDPPEFTPESVLRMMQYEWPGNVRELENAVERTLVRYLDARTARFELPDNPGDPAMQLIEEGNRQGWDLARLEREYILRVLEGLGGRRGETAERLGIDRRTLGRKLEVYSHGSNERVA